MQLSVSPAVPPLSSTPAWQACTRAAWPAAQKPCTVCPVVRKEDGTLEGRDAVIDKDLAAAIMAKSLNADVFLISTAVPKVCINFGKPNQVALDKMTTEEAHKYIGEGHFAPGSMLPKIQAITDYVETTGGIGIITDPDHLKEALDGTEGTRVVRL